MFNKFEFKKRDHKNLEGIVSKKFQTDKNEAKLSKFTMYQERGFAKSMNLKI